MSVMVLSPAQEALAVLDQDFQVLLGKVIIDLETVGSPILTNLFTSIANNPSVSNIVAQKALFLLALPLALPNLESAVAKDAANMGLQYLVQLKAIIAGQPVPAAS